MQIANLPPLVSAPAQIGGAMVLLASCAWVCSFRPSPDEVDRIREEVTEQLGDVRILLSAALGYDHTAPRRISREILCLASGDVPTVDTMTELERDVLSNLHVEAR